MFKAQWLAKLSNIMDINTPPYAVVTSLTILA